MYNESVLRPKYEIISRRSLENTWSLLVASRTVRVLTKLTMKDANNAARGACFRLTRSHTPSARATIVPRNDSSLRIHIPAWALQSTTDNVKNAYSTTPTARSGNGAATALSCLPTNLPCTVAVPSTGTNDAPVSIDLRAAAREAVLRNGIPVLRVDPDGNSVMKRSAPYPAYDNRAVPRTDAHIHCVTGTGRRYHRRGDRPFVTSHNLSPWGTKRYARTSRTVRNVMEKSIREFKFFG